MKKFLSFTLVICTVCLMAIGLVGCSSKPKFALYECDDLTEKAQITASENNDDVAKLTDDSDSKWTIKNKNSYIDIAFKEPTDLNTVVMSEPSDSVWKFEIYYLNSETNDFEMIYRQDRIDMYRMCSFEDIKTNKIRIKFIEFDKKVSISNLEVFYIKNVQGDFARQGYMTDALNSEGVSYIQERKNDPDFVKSLNVLTDVIIIGNVILNQDATINCTNGIDDLKKDIATLKELTDGRLKVHVTILTGLVSNDFSGNNKAMVKFAKEKLNDFKVNLREFVEYVDCDGIDYDWEYPQLPHEWNAYNKLLIATKGAINGRQLSVALWPYGINLSKEARSAIDRVNLMGYDQFDERGDHSSAYECGLKAIEYAMSKGFTKNQIMLGVPFYGRTTDKRSYWPPYDESYGRWDNYKPNYHYVDYDGVTEYDSSVYLNSYAAIRDKTALSLAYEIGGMMIWNFTGDLPYSHENSLHKAMNEILSQRLAGYENVA